MKNKRKLFTFFLLGLFLSPLGLSLAADDPRVKALLQEALRLYSERQYVRALDLFKQVQQIDPTNETATEYIESSQQRIMEWEKQDGDYGTSNKPAASWESLLNSRTKGSNVESITNAKDIIAARRSLVQRMKNRALNTGNIVKIEDTKRGVNVTLFHDQLFLPGLQTLRDGSLVLINNVADLIRTSGERNITVRSLAHSDSTDPFYLMPEFPVPAPEPGFNPANRGGGNDESYLFGDIEAFRAFILFTYIAQQSMGKSQQAFTR